MAIYPVLLIQYLGFFLPGLGWLERWIVALAMIWGATWLNLRGTRVVGTASGWFVAAVLAPFAVLAAVAVARSDEHTSELQSPYDLVCRLLLEKKKRAHS